MVTSIVFTGKHNVGVENEKFMLGGDKNSIKDVPFVRYRFDNYTQEEIEYIKRQQLKFKYSTHLAELQLSSLTAEQIGLITSQIENIAIFIYVPITDTEVSVGLSAEIIENLKSIASSMYDRIMLKDKSTSLYLVSANNLKAQIASVIGIKAEEIGICGSPLSFGTEPCLTAIKARELISLYSLNDGCAIPSANHQCMNTCGCIRYVVISSDVPAPVSKKKTSTSSGSKANKSSKTKVKVNKAPLEWV